MNQSEPTAALRTIDARLLDTSGNPLPLNHVFAVGDLKIVQPSGAISNADHLPAPRAGATAGSFSILLDVSEIAQIGNVRLQLVAAGIDYWEWIEPIVPALTLTTGSILGLVVDPNAPAGEQTLQECLNVIKSVVAGDAVGLDGPVGSTSSGGPVGNTKHRTEFTVISGKRVFTKRDGTP